MKKSFAFDTPFSKNELIMRLSDLTDPGNYGRSFYGKVDDNHFSLIKCQPFSNNVLNPCLEGKIIETNAGTNIQLNIKLNRNDKVGFIVLLALTLCAMLFLVVSGILSKTLNFFEPIAIMLCFELLCSFVGYIIFSLKAKKAVLRLKKCLNK